MMKVVACLIAALAAIAPVDAVWAEDGPAVRRVKAACAPEVREGFKVREDFWKGSAKSGSRQSLKHQLFRGNEYWFWLGVATTGPVPSLKVYDAKGRPVDVETKSDKGWIAARLLPPRTGSYTVVFVFSPPAGSKGAEVDWAMTYGYR